MSEIAIVTSDNDSDLFEIEVGLMLSQALKEAGTMLVSQKGKKTLLGGSKKAGACGSYSMEEILTEKTVALLHNARNEPRDLYDLYYLTTCVGSIHLTDIKLAIEEKMEFKDVDLTNTQQVFENKEGRLKSSWENRLAHQMTALPEFDEVYRAVKRELRQAELLV